eukprot:367089_1
MRNTLSKSYHGYVRPMVAMYVWTFCIFSIRTKGVLGTGNALQALHSTKLDKSCLVVSSSVEQVRHHFSQSKCDPLQVTWTVTAEHEDENSDYNTSHTRKPMDIVVLMDESGSVQSEESCPSGDCYKKEKDFAKDFMEELDAEIGLFSNGGHAGFQEFSHFGMRYWGKHSNGMWDNSADFNSSIDKLTFSGGYTAIGTAIKKGKKLLKGNNRHNGNNGREKVMLLITDGHESMHSNPIKEAQKAHNAGINVYAVGITNAVNDETMLAITGDEKRVFHVNDFDGLKGSLVENIVSQVAVEECASNVELDFTFWHGMYPNSLNPQSGYVYENAEHNQLSWSVGSLKEPATLSFKINPCTCDPSAVGHVVDLYTPDTGVNIRYIDSNTSSESSTKLLLPIMHSAHAVWKRSHHCNKHHGRNKNKQKPAPTPSSTERPSTESPSTESPSTESPSTESPSTEEPTTEGPTTEEPTTEGPTTEEPTTEEPTTEE